MSHCDRYDFETGVAAAPNPARSQTLPAPLDKINVHVAGGNVIPLQVNTNGSKDSSRLLKANCGLVMAIYAYAMSRTTVKATRGGIGKSIWGSHPSCVRLRQLCLYD